MTAPTPVLPEIERIHRRLNELQRSDPHLSRPITYYRSLSALLSTAQPLAPLPVETRRAAPARVAAGQPMLGMEPADFNRHASEFFFRQVCEMLEEFQTGTQQAIAALTAGRLDVPHLMNCLLIGPLDALEAAGEAAEVGSLTLRVALEYCLRPTLRAWSLQLLDVVSLAGWQRPTCPVCNTPPFLVEFYKSRKLRRLRCGFCGAGWSFPIKKCVHCGNEDPDSQALIADNDDPRMFAQTCKRCKTYIKSVFTEEALPHDLLSLEDLATLYLDQGCQSRGYQRIIANEGIE
jgi:FdhE protein